MGIKYIKKECEIRVHEGENQVAFESLVTLSRVITMFTCWIYTQNQIK